MEPFATVEDYTVRYGSVDDEDILLEILKDATREIMSELDSAGISYADPSEKWADTLMQACRSMANRAVSQDDSEVPIGATQLSQGVGEFQHSFSFRNPYGEVYISQAERKLLGLKRGKAAFVYPGGA